MGTLVGDAVFQSLSGENPISYDSNTNRWSLGAIDATKGGTGLTSISGMNLVYGAASTMLGLISVGPAGSLLVSSGSGSPPAFVLPQGEGLVQYDASTRTFAVPTLTVNQGGTGATSFEANGILFYGNGVLTSTEAGQPGSVLWVNSAGVPVMKMPIALPPLSYDGETHTFSMGEVLPVDRGGTGRTSFSPGALLLGNGTSTLNEISSTSEGSLLLSDGNRVPHFQTLTAISPLNYSASLRNFSLSTVPTSNGGTGRTSLASNGILLGEGASPLVSLSPGSYGQVLQASGTQSDPTFQDPGGLWKVVDQTATSCSVSSSLSQRIYLEKGGRICNLPSSPAPGFQVQFRKYDTGSSSVQITSSSHSVANYNQSGNNSVFLNYPGDWVWLFFTGSKWIDLSQALNAWDSSRSFDSTQIETSGGVTTFVVPPQTYVLRVSVLGGGGGGGDCSGSSEPCGGGGGGGYAERSFAVTPGASYSVLVGLGGNAGVSGGQSKFYQGSTDWVAASGGSPGISAASQPGQPGQSGGAGGMGTVGDLLLAGGGGGNGVSFTDSSGTYFQGGGGGSGAGMNGAGRWGRSAIYFASSGLGISKVGGGIGAKGSLGAAAGASITLDAKNRNSGGGGTGANGFGTPTVGQDAGNYGSGGGGGGKTNFGSVLNAGRGSGGFVVIQY
jgi:hypothetical protein